MSAFDPKRTLASAVVAAVCGFEMGRLPPDPSKWMPELRAVLTAMAAALCGRTPNATLIVALLPEYRECLPGNEVVIEYFPDGYSSGPPEAEYAVSLRGGPFWPSWLIAEVDMHRFISSAS